MKKYFLTGLIILLPLAVTLAVLAYLIHLLTDPFIDLVSSLLTHLHIINNGLLFLSPEQFLRYSSQLLILIFLFIFTVILGMFTRTYFVDALFKMGDSILRRIPLVSTVYKTTRDIIKTLFVSDKSSLKQVVIVPFSKPGMFTLGLVASDSPRICSDAAKEDLVSVLIPTTPNPTTGFLMLFRRKDLILIDMKAEDALKYIISCGMIHPDTLGETIKQ